MAERVPVMEWQALLVKLHLKACAKLLMSPEMTHLPISFDLPK